MAIRATLSIIGLMEYDDSLFDDISFPTGIEKESAVNYILMRSAGLELALPDWDWMHMMLPVWVRKNFWKWTKLQASTEFNYNPIWNKDGTITETLEADEDGSGTNTGTVTNVNEVSGYNVNTYSPEARSTTTPNTAWSDTRTKGETRTRTEQGNIGITSTQQLIKEEREVADFSIYEVIARDFLEEFCLLVY